MEFSTRFPYSEILIILRINFALFPHTLQWRTSMLTRINLNFWLLTMATTTTTISALSLILNSAFLKRNKAISNTGKLISRSRKSRKLCEKYHFRIRKSSTKFHFKVRKPHLNYGKHGTNKNGLEFDVEKYCGIIFLNQM